MFFAHSAWACRAPHSRGVDRATQRNETQHLVITFADCCLFRRLHDAGLNDHPLHEQPRIVNP
ncbi:hypothetical protein [Burkholderia sp. WSM2232]|uniref:hypothetical protein n=1 Tax=Burkholderia sp. WSM2232 TaxID=944436 RepID=UPI000413B540|nr:hypothetical protein [Burkholderia sp. WSM2232]